MAERIVELLVDIELADAIGATLTLLPGREVGREVNAEGTRVVVKLAVPEAPEGAVGMTPWFSKHADGSVTLRGIEYYGADLRRLN